MSGHFLEILIIAVIGLALFGPKALQSAARSAGKGVGQAKQMKDKIMSELPMEDVSKVAEQIPQVPRNSRQAIQMLIAPAENKPQETKPAEKLQEAEADEAR